MRDVIRRFSAPLWKWKGDSAWHFVTLPFDDADEIDAHTAHVQRGFGSVRVRVTVGGSTWATSVFPSKEERSYVLPMKAAVRTKEGLKVGDPVDITLEVLDLSPDA